MAAFKQITVRCGGCGQGSQATMYQSINVAEDPELKEKVISGEVFMHECPHCGAKNLIKGNLLYHDPDEHLLICLSDQTFYSDGMEGYTCRLVSDIGSLIEKVKIFSAGLDDVIMEMCKYVTAQEMGGSVDLKFLNMDGADHDITLTYPKDGQMEMLEIGFNVYEDCAGIVNRNPVIRENAKGLARIDQDWLSRFFK